MSVEMNHYLQKGIQVVDNIVDATFVGPLAKEHNTTKFANYYASGRTQKVVVCNGNFSEIVVQETSL